MIGNITWCLDAVIGQVLFHFTICRFSGLLSLGPKPLFKASFPP